MSTISDFIGVGSERVIMYLHSCFLLLSVMISIFSNIMSSVEEQGER